MISAIALPGLDLPGRRERPGKSGGTGLSGCSGDERGNNISGVPVQAGPRPVVAHGGARVGMGGGLLHVPQRDPGVERGSDERVPQRVRAHVLGDPGATGDPADGPGGAVPVQPPPVRGDKERAFGALAGRQVDRAGGARGERDGDDRASLIRTNGLSLRADSVLGGRRQVSTVPPGTWSPTARSCPCR